MFTALFCRLRRVKVTGSLQLANLRRAEPRLVRAEREGIMKSIVGWLSALAD